MDIITKHKRVFGALILTLIVICAFSISVSMRQDKFDEPYIEHHHHLTGSTAVFTNNWLAGGGMFKNLFTLYETTNSIEYENQSTRVMYDSYPSGCIIPVYIIAKMLGKEYIGFGEVQGWNLFNQLVITWLLCMLIYLILLRKVKLKVYQAFGFALIPIFVQLFMPAPYYFFQNVYFADQGVLMPFVMVIFIESLRSELKSEKLLRTANFVEGFLIFFGTLIDWLWVMLLVCIYIKRLITGEINCKSFKKWFKQSLALAWPALLALLLFILKVVYRGPVRVLDMLKFRTGADGDSSGWIQAFERIFWTDYIVKGYGKYANIIMKGAFVVLVVLALLMIVSYIHIYRKDRERDLNNRNALVAILTSSLLIITPCFMQVYALRNHSAIHDFSTLKFSLVMSVVIYVLTPLAIYFVIKWVIDHFSQNGVNSWLKRFGSFIVTVIMVACIGVSGYATISTHKTNAAGYYPENFYRPDLKITGEFVRENTDYNDVVFSGDIEYPPEHPWKLIYSMKIVHPFTDKSSVDRFVKNIDQNDDYTINILTLRNTKNDNRDLNELKGLSYEIIDGSDGMKLYKIRKEDYILKYKK